MTTKDIACDDDTTPEVEPTEPTETDWDEEHRRPRRLSRQERYEAMADAGIDTWDDYHCRN